MGTLVMLLVAIVVVAIVLWIIRLLELGSPANKILQVVVAVILLLWVLAVFFGVFPHPHFHD